jgi:hypothetical protein
MTNRKEQEHFLGISTRSVIDYSSNNNNENRSLTWTISSAQIKLSRNNEFYGGGVVFGIVVGTYRERRPLHSRLINWGRAPKNQP